MDRSFQIRIAATVICAAGVIAAYEHTRTEDNMLAAANNLLASLTTEQKAKAMLPFGDKMRLDWHFVPDNNYAQTYKHGRPGLTYKEMTPPQRRLADALLGASFSQAGFVKAASIMSLEDVLRISEKDETGRRDPEKYYFTFFGKPAATGNWAFRVEGHHVSASFTIKDGRMIASTPGFFGANPHEVREGPRAGIRVLAREEDLARGLMMSLSDAQKKTALIDGTAYKDILTAASQRAQLEGAPRGLKASELNAAQFDVLMNLVAEYASNVPPDIAARRIGKVKNTPREQIYFAWAGSIAPGAGDYYRVQTPAVLIEYDNTQNGNNHSHTVWRDLKGDFGFDVLAYHHRMYDHGLARAAD